MYLSHITSLEISYISSLCCHFLSEEIFDMQAEVVVVVVFCFLEVVRTTAQMNDEINPVTEEYAVVNK